MNFAPIDYVIMAGYLAATLYIGFYIARKASRSIRHYFLGGNEIPWYALGVSNASGMFDISGTMWLVYLLFIYGLKSLWIPWLWPVFNQIFLMVYLSIWLRRSGVMTGAEWIRFRFGDNRPAQLAHVIVVVFALFNVVGFLAYGFIGIGKFAAAFLPWELSSDPTTNVNLWGLLITAITTLYVVKGGMFSVVFTEVLQFCIMTVACVWIGIIAIQRVSPQMLDAVIPNGWRSPFFGWELGLDWTGIMDAANTRIVEDGWSWFSIFFMLMLFKGVLQSGAGPAPNYDMQRILSTRSPREAAKMSMFVNVVLNPPRYMMVTALTILALAFFSPQLAGMGDGVDFELILPWALRNFVPAGLLGLLIAALLAAFMSTYAATVNAAPAYIVNDLYKRYINPDAEEKVYVRMSYVASLAVVVVGTGFGFFIASLNDIVQWIVAALYGGYTAANLLKWYWWRFNAYGYFWGMAAGILSSMVIPAIFSDVAPIFAFPFILAASVAGCIAGTLMTPADDMEVLKRFYLRTRPWGFWRPVHEALVAERPDVVANGSFRRDAFNIVVGIIWQTSLTATGIFLVLQDWFWLTAVAFLAVVTSVVLKFTWYDHLQDYPADLGPDAGREEHAAIPPATAVIPASA
jgi:solute:Na+ symporter, SSS family